MKSILVVLAVVVAASASIIPAGSQLTPYKERSFEEQIKKLFEGWLEKVKEVDPITSEYEEFNIYVLSGYIKNALVAGFSGQFITNLVISVNALKPGVEMTYEIPYLEASIEHYKLDGVIPGDGTVSLVTKDLKFEGVARYNVLKPWESVFKVDYHLGGEFKLTGFMDSEELSAGLTELINKYLNWFNK